MYIDTIQHNSLPAIQKRKTFFKIKLTQLIENQCIIKNIEPYHHQLP